MHLRVIEACRVICLCRCFSSLLAYTLVTIKNLKLACLLLKIDLCLTWSNIKKNSLNVIQVEKAPSNRSEEVVPFAVIFLGGSMLVRFGLFFPVKRNVPPPKSKLWSPKEKQVPHEHPHK